MDLSSMPTDPFSSNPRGHPDKKLITPLGANDSFAPLDEPQYRLKLQKEW